MRSRRLFLLTMVLLGCDRADRPVAVLPLGAAAASNPQSILAFSHNVDASWYNYEIYTMNGDGTGATRLTDIGGFDERPSWSPDGSRIAFQSTRDGHAELYVMNADGSGVTRLTNSSPYGSFGPAAWCGDRIAFMSTRDGPAEIYVMNADGTGVTRLTNNTALNVSPSWSPTCTQLAFESDSDGIASAEIYVMNADGTGATRLTNNTVPDQRPAWSPDGSRIAFSSNYQIYAISPDGSGATQLTHETGAAIEPAWSPDGSQIAFTGTPDRNFDLFVMNADGSGVTRLTYGAGLDNRSPAWRPNPPPPPPLPIHVGDLNGAASDNTGPSWSATVEITAHEADDTPLSGATVTGVWSVGGLTASCTTGATGVCVASLPAIKKSVPSVVFTVSDVTMSGRSYEPGSNHDADGSSDGTSITVSRR